MLQLISGHMKQVPILILDKYGHSEGESRAESDDIREITLPLTILKRVVADVVLKLNRKSKGS